jgi:undecaprenyl pyrophosphate phosphatase UppP
VVSLNSTAIAAALYLVAGKLFKGTGTYMDPFKALGEAHRFTAWKKFFIMMIPTVIFGITVFTIVI